MCKAKLTYKIVLNFVLWLIILKPLFDLDWQWPLFYIGSSPIPFHRIIAFIVPATISILVILRLQSNASIRVNNNIFAIVVLVSITITLYFQKDVYSLDEYIRSYNFFLIFISTPFLISSKQEFYRVAKFVTLVSLFPTFLSYLQALGFLPFTYFDSLPSYGQIGRISGGYHHPTGYLNYLLFIIPLAIYLYTNKLISKKFLFFWLLFTLPMVCRSLHRATIILVFFDLAVYFFFLRKTMFKYLAIICFFALLIIYFQNIWQFINVGGAITEQQFRGRDNIWALYIDHFNSGDLSQQIFGFGSPKLPNGFYEPHSDWLRIIFNYGYFGLITYLLFLFNTFRIFFIKFLKSKIKFIVNSEALLGIMLVSTIVLYSITMEPLRYSSFSWGCALILGYVFMSIIRPIKVSL